MNERYASILSILMIGVVFSPIVKNWEKKPQDSFPLSHYPMFSEKRNRNMSLTYMVGIGTRGERYKIPYAYVGSGGLNQVRKQIRKRVDKGEANGLCQSVASK